VFDSCEAAIVPKPKARLCEPWETCHRDEWSPQSGRHRRSAAPANLLTLSQGSPSLALGLNTPTASQLAKLRPRLRSRLSLLKPGQSYKYDIDLWFTSRVIPASHRLRVVVASAAFPKYDRNLNTGGDNERDTHYVVVRQRILQDRAHPSFVRLPIIPR